MPILNALLKMKRGALYYECSENCIPFAAYGLCSHVLAMVELDKKLEDFILWYKKLKQSPANVTALAEMHLPSSRGTKRTKATQIRKGGKNYEQTSKADDSRTGK